MKNQFSRVNRRGVVIGLTLALLSATGAGAWWAWRTESVSPLRQSTVSPPVQSIAPTTPSTSLPIKPSQPAEPSRTKSPEVYRLRLENNQVRLAPTQIAIAPGASSDAALTQAMNELLSNRQTAELSSSVPEGTRLLSLKVAPQAVSVDLSREFAQGGGSESMIDRVAQVLYTATSLEPTAKVYLSIEGKPIDENHPLGGEGIILQQPTSRQQFTSNFKDMLR